MDLPQGAKTRARSNIEIIKLLHTIEREGRRATAEEQAKLARYVGWGGIPQVFDPRNKDFRKLYEELKQVLADEEYTAARASTPNAHYTSDDVVRGVWNAVERVGFKGGRILEPALGTGNFFGLVPEGIKDRATLVGVELDSVTGRIARQLYPQADIRVEGYERTNFPDNYFDLAISNVPFGNFPVADPRYDALKLPIHDYFFAKSIDKVRPGGLVAFITSHFTLDKQTQKFRRWLGERADFVGAIRLPSTAFKGNAATEVTTDIILLRKKHPTESFQGEPFTAVVRYPTPEGDAQINTYFASKPKMMLGSPRLIGKLRGYRGEFTLRSSGDLVEQLAEAITNLPGAWVTSNDPVTTDTPQDRGTLELPEGAVENEFFRRGGNFFQVRDGVAQPVTFKTKAGVLMKKDRDRVDQLIGIRTAARRLLDLQLAEADPAEIERTREDLAKLYDPFVRRYGPINQTKIAKNGARRMDNIRPFQDDPGAALVSSLESYDIDTGKADKAAIFFRNVIQPRRPIEAVDNPADAIPIVLDRLGRLDVDEIARMSGLDVDEAIKRLKGRIYMNPETGAYETADEYLSGNVRRKLDRARAAGLDENVAALEQVQPQDLKPEEIDVPLGAAWVSAEDVGKFLAFLGGRPSEQVPVTYVAANASWHVGKGRLADELDTSASVKWGTRRLSAFDIALDVLNSRTIKVVDRVRIPGGGTQTTPNVAETQAANARAKEMRLAFKNWIWADQERTVRLATKYNYEYNNLVARKFDGSYLTMPGLAPVIRVKGETVPFNLHPWQKNSIARIVQRGDTLLGHVVGAGKTFTMIGAGMEMRRLGLVRKPTYVVPNHMLEQFSREFLQAYPAAKILVADERNFAAKERRRFVARIATEDNDAIVITHSAFERIPVSRAYEQAFLLEQITEYAMMIGLAKEEEGKGSITVKELEKVKKRFETRLTKLMKREKKDAGVTFEQTGIDFLFVDEAHLFKNLSFATRMTNVRGLSQGNAQRALDLFLKTRYLAGLNPGRSTVFATGTPISNTMAEMFTMQRYLQPRMLAERGVASFDAWAKTFGEVIDSAELKPSGKGFRVVQRFAQFVNVPELIGMFSAVADIQTAETIGLKRPDLEGGEVEIVDVEPTTGQREYVAKLAERAEKIKGQRPEKGMDNMLKIVGEGRKAALDLRLIEDRAEAGNKITAVVDNVFKIWQEDGDPRLAQIIFADLGTPGNQRRQAPSDDDIEAEDADESINVTEEGEVEIKFDDEGDAATLDTGWNVYEEIRRQLVKRGVPAEQVAFIHEAKTDGKKARLFEDVRRGKVRVLIGSTAKMGVGTNVQRKLYAMHHVDAPWRPADVEQRDGRILRQGNENGEVRIVRYVTRATFDAYMWQILVTKAKFIGQILAGAKGKRRIEDVDTPLPEAARVRAIATGDERFLRQAELDQDVQELTVLAKAHEDQQRSVKRLVASLPGEIEEVETVLRQAEADQKKATDLGGKKFRAGFEGKTYARQQDFNEALLAAIQRRLKRASPGEDVVIGNGEISGFRFAVGVRIQKFEENVAVIAMRLKGENSYVAMDSGFKREDLNTVNYAQRLVNTVGRIGEIITKRRNELESLRTQLSQAEEELGKPFARQDEFEGAVAELDALNRELSEDKPTTEEITEAPKPMLFTKAVPTPRYATDRVQLAVELERLLRRVAPQLRRVDFFNDIVFQNEAPVGGFVAIDDVMRVAIESRHFADKEHIVRHEVIHHLRNLGLLSDTDMEALYTKVADWMQEFKVVERWGSYYDSVEPNAARRQALLEEEAIAEAYGAWGAGRKFDTPISRVFQAIRNWWRRIKQLLTNRGYRTAEDVFQSIERGIVGRRPRQDMPHLSEPMNNEAFQTEFKLYFDEVLTVDWQRKTMQRGRDIMRPILGIQKPGEVFHASQGKGGIIVEQRRDSSDLSPLKRMFFKPQNAFKGYPSLVELVEQGITAETNVSEFVTRFNTDWDLIRGRLRRAERQAGERKDAWFERLADLLWIGDAYQEVFGRDALIAEGVPIAVIDAYQESRTLIEKIGRFVDQHRRAMVPQARSRKSSILRRMARIRDMGSQEFRSLYNKRTRLRKKFRENPSNVGLASELAQIEKSLQAIRVDTEQYKTLLEELDRIEALLQQVSIRRIKGYVPHKFFGSWGVYEREDGANPDTGELETHHRLLAGENGFHPDMRTALQAAKAYLKDNPDADIVVRPKQFSFPSSDATGLSDASYWRFVGRVSKALEIGGDELHELVRGVARRPFRRRIAGFTQRRTGVEGYSRDVDKVIRTHIGEAVRYVELDKLKYDAITTMERLGLSPYRSSTENPTLQRAVQAWFRDVNGQKQPAEVSIDNMLNKPWAQPIRPALAAGLTTFLTFGMAGNPVIGGLVGSYVGYRLYKTLRNAGTFKTRAIANAMTGDMTHLKLGAFFNVYSPLVNLTQTLVNTYPILGERYTMAGMRLMEKAGRSRFAGNPNRYWRLLQRADIATRWKYSEVSTRQFSRESRFQRASLFLFDSAEQFNRAVSFLGAYQRAIDQGATEGEAMRQGRDIMRQTQHHYGSAAKPEILRIVWAKPFVQFKNYMMQQIAFITGLRGAQIPRFLVALFLVAGGLGLPGIGILALLINALFKFDIFLEAKWLALKAQAEGWAQGTAAQLVLRGLPSLIGDDLSIRVGFGDKFLPSRLRDFWGPWASTIEGAYRLGEANATISDHIRNWSPGLGNPLKTLEAHANGTPIEDVITGHVTPAKFYERLADGTVIYTNPWRGGYIERTSEDLAWHDLIRLSLGGTPLQVAKERDVVAYTQYQAAKNERQSRKYFNQVLSAYRRYSDDKERLDEVLRNINKHVIEDGVSLGNVSQKMRNAYTPMLERAIRQARKDVRMRDDLQDVMRVMRPDLMQPEPAVPPKTNLRVMVTPP